MTADPPHADPQLLALSGGEARLRPLIEDFYDVVFADTMIGFFFAGKDKQELVRLELEHVLEFLGADQPYTGRPLRVAHASHRIMGGQFNRRLQLLKEAMERHDLHPEVRRAWVAHTERLRAEITPDAAGECKPPR